MGRVLEKLNSAYIMRRDGLQCPLTLRVILGMGTQPSNNEWGYNRVIAPMGIIATWQSTRFPLPSTISGI